MDNSIFLRVFFFFAVFYFLGFDRLSAQEAPIVCGLGDMSGLREKRQVIQCDVKIKITVTDALLNDKKCEAPIAYQMRLNSYHKKAGLPAFADFKDFRRSYFAGESFYFAIPDNCFVETYTIVAGEKEFTWSLK